MEEPSVSIINVFVEQVRAFGSMTDRELLSLDMMFERCDAGRFELRPPYQRNFVWKKDVACRLIESVMLNVAIPEIYVRRTPANKRSRDEMVDGRQRCMALSCFYRNENPWSEGEDFRLTGCERLPMLNGLKFDDFPAPMQMAFLNYKLGIIAAVGLNNQAVAALFELLNQNTVRLTAQEIRNASYQGPFNDLCKELADLPEFKKLISKSLALRMESTQLVVRFLAFYRQGIAGYSKTSGNSLEGFISSEMAFWQEGNYTEAFGRSMKNAFLNAVYLSDAVFGKDVFRKKPGAKARISNVLFELVMCGFADRELGGVLSKAAEIKAALFGLCAETKFNAAISRATGDRNNVTYRFLGWEAVLDRILGGKAKRALKDKLPVETWLQQSILVPDPVLESILVSDPVPERLPCAVVELPVQVDVNPIRDPFEDDEERTFVTDPKVLANYRQQVVRMPLKDRTCSRCGGAISDEQMEKAAFEAAPTVNGTANVDVYHGDGDCVGTAAVM